MSGSSLGMTSLQASPGRRCERLHDFLERWITLANPRQGASCCRKRPYTFHATALLWSNRHGVWAERRRPSVNVRAALTWVTLDWVRRANGYHTEPETDRSAACPERARGRRARARLRPDHARG